VAAIRVLIASCVVEEFIEQRTFIPIGAVEILVRQEHTLATRLLEASHLNLNLHTHALPSRILIDESA